jgi:polyisoprenoid-binding protein YceI
MLLKTIAVLSFGVLAAGQAIAADYVIDKEGQHAFIDLKVKHLEYSFITGTFRDLDGTFSFDAAEPEASKIEVNVRTASLFTNHTERDKHLRDKEYLNVEAFPHAKFVSTGVKLTGKNAEGKQLADVTGNLSLGGVTKPILVKATFLGEGKDPWGGYRAGFEGTTSILREDYGQTGKLEPGSSRVELYITFEGIRAK